MISYRQQSWSHFFFSSLVFLLIFILSGCDQDNDTSSTPSPDPQTQDGTLPNNDNDNSAVNRPPVAKIGAVTEQVAGQIVTLDGGGSFDPDGDILTYLWTQTQGEKITLADNSNPTLNFVAPTVNQPTQYTFELTVNDGKLNNLASVELLVLPVSSTGSCTMAEAGDSLMLSCPSGEVITEVSFASYGNPGGSCGSFTTGTCNASSSVAVVSDACVGKNSCSLYVGNDTFGGDPCEGMVKKLAAEVACGMATEPAPDTNPEPDQNPNPEPDPNPNPNPEPDPNPSANADGVKFSSSEGQGFTQIEINNPVGSDVVLASLSESEGAVGVKVKGKLLWLRGIPEGDMQNGYTWDLNGNTKVKLVVIDSSNNSPDFSFTAEGGDVTIEEWQINIKSSADEYFTGIFERVVDGSQGQSWKPGLTTALNLRGEKVDMHLKPTVSAYAPFYISSENYSFFVKGTWPGVFDFCKTNKSSVKVSFEGPEFSFSWHFGTPLELVQQHALQTGPSIIPPEWSLGPWRWRDDHSNKSSYYDGTKKNSPYNTDLVEDVLMMQALDIPATAHWIDRPWGPGSRGFDDYEFDSKRVPHPEEMIKWLNSKGIELMMWIAPFVMGNMADYAEENGYDLISKGNSEQTLMDFTNPEAVQWWGENGPGKLARMGIKGYKLDRADGEKLLDDIGRTTSIGTTYRENFNDYPRQYVKAAYEAIEPVLGNDFILFPRAQYTGSAKYGGMWAGDTNGRHEGLRSAIIGMQRTAVMGYPLWGSDIGGYWGDFSRESTARWIAFGCFSPLMETGPTQNKGFWGMSYDKELLAIWRLYSKLRMQLIPYIAELTKEANEYGTPIVRPLFLAYPDAPEAWKDWQTYLFGNDLLVSAIWEKGKTKHSLYLPDGEQWIDAWNPDVSYQGGQTIEVEAPLYKIPVFIRVGSGIELGDLESLYRESLDKVDVIPDLGELEKAEGWR